MNLPKRRNIRAVGFRDKLPRKGILGSDLRVRGGHFGRCILCGQQKTLCLSHVIPKWAYKWHKAGHGGTVRGMFLSQELLTIDQDGEKHYLMCRECEVRSSKSEAYIYALTNGSTVERRSFGIVESPKNTFVGFNFTLAVRFIASIALRAHYANSLLFRDVHLPRSSRAALRRVIFRNPCDSATPWFMGVQFCPPPKQSDHDPRQDIWVQYIENDFAGAIFTVFVGGWEWYAAFSIGTELAKVAYDARLRDVENAEFLLATYDLHRNIEFLYKDGRLM